MLRLPTAFPFSARLLASASLLFAAVGCSDGGGSSSEERTPCDPTDGAICTLAGTGVPGLSPDGLAPEETEFYLPQDMTVGPDGLLYILDWNNHRVRVIERGIEEAVVQTVIGTGSLGDAPDGKALDASLNHPTHVSFSPTGELILSAWHNSKVLRYDASTKEVHAICGTGARSFNGDGMEGTVTELDLPVATAFAPDGRMYIADQANQRIRVLDEEGMVSTAVGTGEPGYSGDGGPALEAELHLPVSQSAPPAGRIATDSRGVLYIADTLNHVIRKVDTDGIITTIAGTGSVGTGGEGEATSIALDTPSDVAIDQDGNVYVADTLNSCIRKIDTEGQMTTVVGVCGELGYEGDGGPPNEALLNRPYGIEVGPDGILYIADTHNHVLRYVLPN